jgi:hypothetical protein
MDKQQEKIVFDAVKVLEDEGIIEWRTSDGEEYAEVTLVKKGKDIAFSNRNYKVSKPVLDEYEESHASY